MSNYIYNYNITNTIKKNKACYKTSFNKNNTTTIFVLLFKEQYYYLQTKHSYHLVDPSPWPLIALLGVTMLTTGGVLYMHRFSGGWGLFLTGGVTILFVVYTWWRDIVREATFEDQHTKTGQKGLGMIFIISEIMFFFAFFWAFFHSSITPVYAWSFSSLAGIIALTIQTISGLFLSMNYTASIEFSYLPVLLETWLSPNFTSLDDYTHLENILMTLNNDEALKFLEFVGASYQEDSSISRILSEKDLELLKYINCDKKLFFDESKHYLTNEEKQKLKALLIKTLQEVYLEVIKPLFYMKNSQALIFSTFFEVILKQEPYWVEFIESEDTFAIKELCDFVPLFEGDLSWARSIIVKAHIEDMQVVLKNEEVLTFLEFVVSYVYEENSSIREMIPEELLQEFSME